MQRRANASDHLSDIQLLIHKIEEARKSSESVINGLQLSKKANIKLAMEQAAHEEKLIRQALANVYELNRIRNEARIDLRASGAMKQGRSHLLTTLKNSASTLPLFVSQPGTTKLPRLVGCTPAASGYIAKSGEMVAACVKIPAMNKDGLEENIWILAVVRSYKSNTRNYEVQDVDEEQSKIYILSKRHVVPLPTHRANPETDQSALFPLRSIVLAVYPQTTCFYRAMVTDQPKTAQQDYTLLFEEEAGDFIEPASVPQRYVIPVK